MRTHRQRLGAFTLVEILVVLAIVALLAALLLTVFGRVRENGRRTVCASNLHQIMAAMALYTQDSAGQYPPMADFETNLRLRSSPAMGSWTDALLPLLSTPQLLHCPSDELWEQRLEFNKRFRHSNAPNGAVPTVPCSYLVNSRTLTREYASVFFKPLRIFPTIRAAHEQDVVSPASTVIACDGGRNAWEKSPYTQDYPGDIAKDQAQLGDMLDDPTGMPESSSCCSPTNPCLCGNAVAPNDRHSGRANVAFADGHVKSMLNSQWYFPGTPYLDPKRGG